MCLRYPIVALLRRTMIRFERFIAFSFDQKLFAHFSKTGAAIFTIEQV